VIPRPIDAFDRQRGLQDSIEYSFAQSFGTPALSRSFYGLVPTAASPSVPYLFLNTTSVDGGDRVVGTRIIMLNEEFNYTRTFWDVDWSQDFTVMEMAGTSARFPFLSPSGYVRNGDRVERPAR
jgi:hypothetical protein